jgi:hypothetical protein
MTSTRSFSDEKKIIRREEGVMKKATYLCDTIVDIEAAVLFWDKKTDSLLRFETIDGLLASVTSMQNPVSSASFPSFIWCINHRSELKSSTLPNFGQANSSCSRNCCNSPLQMLFRLRQSQVKSFNERILCLYLPRSGLSILLLRPTTSKVGYDREQGPALHSLRVREEERRLRAGPAVVRSKPMTFMALA